jgi:hypothetical protein
MPPPDPNPPEEEERDESLEALSNEAVREIEKRRDGSGGYAGEGDIG